MVKRVALFALVSMLCLAIGGWAEGTAQKGTVQKQKANVLNIYDWWTSGSEKAAIDALIAVYHKEYPSVTVIQSPVAGGAGASMRQVIHALMLGGEAPDSFQSYPFGLIPYWKAGMLQSIDEVWTPTVQAQVPTVVKNMVKMPDGHFYSVPVGIQQAGMVFYNIPIFKKYGLSPPKTVQDFDHILTTLKANGVDAIALGDKNSWPLLYVFRTLTAAEGLQYYQDFINGKVTSATNPKLVDSLQKLNSMLNYVNSDHAALTWDEAAARVAKGGAAMNIMGDAAVGEFLVAHQKYGTDFGTFKLPGAQDIYGVSLDVFGLPKGAQHPQNAINWFKTVMTPEAQSAFAGPKGEIPALLNASLDVGFSGYQRNESEVHFQNAKYFRPGMYSGTPGAFMGKLQDIISQQIGVNRDPQAAAQQIATLESQTSWPKTWNLFQ